MNTDIKIKDDIRYIVATMDNVPMFLIRDSRGVNSLKFALSDDVSRALKATSLEAAQGMLTLYKGDSGDDRDFAILKLRVSYQLIDD